MSLNIDYLKSLLERRGWSERNLAIRSGLSSATISRIISGKRGLGARTISGIRKAFPEEPIDKLFF
jgi:Helix-turn-helix.